MAASTLSRVTSAIAAVKTVTRLVIMRFMGMEPQYINSHKKDPVAKTAGYIQFDNVFKKTSRIFFNFLNAFFPQYGRE